MTLSRRRADSARLQQLGRCGSDQRRSFRICIHGRALPVITHRSPSRRHRRPLRSPAPRQVRNCCLVGCRYGCRIDPVVSLPGSVVACIASRSEKHGRASQRPASFYGQMTALPTCLYVPTRIKACPIRTTLSLWTNLLAHVTNSIITPARYSLVCPRDVGY